MTSLATEFNAEVGSGGRPSVVDDVQDVTGTLWLDGDFTHVGGVAQAALASVSPTTGAYTNNVTEQFSGVVTTTTPLKVHKIAINSQQTKAAVIGNFAQIDRVTHKEVVLLNINANGGSTSASPWNAPTYSTPVRPHATKETAWRAEWTGPDRDLF